MGVSLNLINGITGQFSLGHAGFMAIGAYVSAYLTKMQGLPFSLALLMGGLMAGFGGLIVGVPTLRLKGDYLAIATLGFGEIIRVVIINLEVVGGPRGIPGIPQYTTFLWVFAMVVFTIFFISNLGNSRHGRALIAIREDETAADTMGIDTTKFKITAFVIGSMFAGLAGGLYAHRLTYIDPSQFDFMKSIEIPGHHSPRRPWEHHGRRDRGSSGNLPARATQRRCRVPHDHLRTDAYPHHVVQAEGVAGHQGVQLRDARSRGQAAQGRRREDQGRSASGA
ncbi:MAG: branched-chain amino acid ABC transporter permease [Desulfomicrobium escambiense]|nr:branched-chain amino acid ABC transporter permease [Desulfomicrobium escambiense]